MKYSKELMVEDIIYKSYHKEIIDHITTDFINEIHPNILSGNDKIITAPVITEEKDYRCMNTILKMTVNIMDLIRCKDCAYYQGNNGWCAALDRVMNGTDYCSYAERKEVINDQENDPL